MGEYFVIGGIIHDDRFEDGVIPVEHIELYGSYEAFDEADDAINSHDWGVCWIVSLNEVGVQA
jgi:hypothetical protein